MQFQISSGNGGWNITPLSGTLEGQIVATAEGLNLLGVKFAGKTIIGSIKALWGATILLESVYSDMETLRAISLGGVFDTKVEERLTLDYDGFSDRANKVCRSAKKLLLIGADIYSKGAT